MKLTAALLLLLLPLLASAGVLDAPAQPSFPVTPTDKGGTITAGGMAQDVMAPNGSRRGGWVQNPCDAVENMYVSSTGDATLNGAGDDASLAPCMSWSANQNGLVIQSRISVITATTGHRFVSKETQ